MVRRLGILLVAVLCVGVAGALMAADAIPADRAHRDAVSGAVMLIDVRSPKEWRQTGIPQGAKAISMHGPDGMDGFVARVTKAVNGRKDTPVALICARGVRSTRAGWALSGAGFTRVLNVREGVNGNWVDGPGWIARKLPVETYRP